MIMIAKSIEGKSQEVCQFSLSKCSAEACLNNSSGFRPTPTISFISVCKKYFYGS